jgi:hypothetical protein
MTQETKRSLGCQRRAVLLGAVLLLALGPACTADARSDHHHTWRCRPTHSHVVVADKRAEVFEAGETIEGTFHGEYFDGCVYGSVERFELGAAAVIGSSSGVGGTYDYRLGGTVAGYAEGFEN